MGNMFMNEYPYTDFHEMNLSWVLKKIIELNERLTQFVTLNTIKYADPLDWDITKQYETNTVVIDPNTGTAYLSVKPVPEGVDLSNTDYWTVIFDLNTIIGNINSNLTVHNANVSATATFDSLEGDWLLWNGKLYEVMSDIYIGYAYVPDANIEERSVEELVRGYVASIYTYIGLLSDLQTTDKSSIVNAINEVLSTLASVIGDLNDLNTTDKSSVVNAINEVLSTLASVVGDLNDLNTTDKSSVVNAINEVLNRIDNIKIIYDTYTDAVTDSANFNDGDIIQTRGYSVPGVGAGLYKIHASALAYCIPCGSKYAELLYDDQIDFDALGPSHDMLEATDINDDLLELAFELAYQNKPITSLTFGYENGGTTIKFGPYDYRFTRPLTVPTKFSSITFEGCNHNTVWAFDSSTQFLMTIPARVDNTFTDNVHFKDINFQGTGSMFSIDRGQFLTFTNCIFINGGIGVFLQRCVGVDFYRCVFSLCSVGAILQNQNTTVNFNSCGFRSCNIGLQMLSGDNGVIVKDSIVEYNTTYGMYIESCDEISLIDLWIEGNPNIISGTSLYARHLKTYIGANGIQSTVSILTSRSANLDIEDITNEVVIDNSGGLFTGYVRYAGTSPLSIV